MLMTDFGATGLKVSRLGAGLFQIGNYALSETAQVGRILGSALDAGINFLDTAECYGNSEELIGRTVSHRRHEFVLATKVGHTGPDAVGPFWTADTVRKTIDRSLARLRTDYVDLIQLHAYDIDETRADEVIEAALDAKRAGKTRLVGYSHENEQAERAVESGMFDALQTVFNLVDQRARYGLFDKARARGMGIIAKRPIANMVWARALRGDSGGDETGKWVERMRRARIMVDMGPLPGAPEDPVALALGFVYAHPDAHTSIVGTRSHAHMLANIRATEEHGILAAEVVDELHRRFDSVGRDWPALD